MHGRNRYRVRRVVGSVALALSLVGSLAITTTTPAPAAAAEVTGRAAKAFSPGPVRIDTARLAADGTIEVQADVDGTDTGRVTVEASGAASVERYSEPVGPSGTNTDLDASYGGAVRSPPPSAPSGPTVSAFAQRTRCGPTPWAVTSWSANGVSRIFG